MLIQIKHDKKFKLHDEKLLRLMGCTDEDIKGYCSVRACQQKIGYELEFYLKWVSRLMPSVEIVARKRNRTRHTDAIIKGENWSFKNASTSENSAAKRGREGDGVKNLWFRRDDKDKHYWNKCPIEGASEEGFMDWLEANIVTPLTVLMK